MRKRHTKRQGNGDSRRPFASPTRKTVTEARRASPLVRSSRRTPREPCADHCPKHDIGGGGGGPGITATSAAHPVQYPSMRKGRHQHRSDQHRRRATRMRPQAASPPRPTNPAMDRECAWPPLQRRRYRMVRQGPLPLRARTNGTTPASGTNSRTDCVSKITRATLSPAFAASPRQS